MELEGFKKGKANRGKGGGARKYGRKRKKPSALKYRNHIYGTLNMVKMARIAKKLKAGLVQPGWRLSEGYGVVRDVKEGK
jgi:hypothetical protein